MSSSSFRPFRHAATFTTLCLQTGLVEYRKETDHAIVLNQKQLQTKGINSTKKQNIQEKLTSLKRIQETLESFMSDFFDG